MEKERASLRAWVVEKETPWPGSSLVEIEVFAAEPWVPSATSQLLSYTLAIEQ